MFDFVAGQWPILLAILLILMAVVLRTKKTFFYWAARIVAILDLIFLAIEDLNLLKIVPLAIALLLSWKNDLFGAFSFTAVGIFFLMYFEWGDFPIGFVPILVGIFFAINWLRTRRPKLS